VSKKKILVVEDNQDIRENIVAYFETKGYIADSTEDGLKAFALLTLGDYDLVILDWMLPGMSGIQICESIRKSNSTLPIIMLSAKDMVEDRITGLSSGVDDYLVKPFSLAELKLRVEAVLRRSNKAERHVLTVSDLTIDLDQHTVFKGKEEIKLNPTSFKLLSLLAERSPVAVSRPELEKLLWGEEPPDSDALRTHMHHLRQAIDKPFGTNLIKTVSGFGWAIQDSN
jgi:DNA-binding response OmpR family regulator